ncbi:hypothetical protein BH10ACT11_BH10ACT11_11220 [soil metagenome]
MRHIDRQELQAATQRSERTASAVMNVALLALALAATSALVCLALAVAANVPG